MHGTLTPEQVNLIEINRKRALDLQKTLRVIRDMKRTLAELEEEAERLKKPVSRVIDMTKDCQPCQLWYYLYVMSILVFMCVNT